MAIAQLRLDLAAERRAVEPWEKANAVLLANQEQAIAERDAALAEVGRLKAKIERVRGEVDGYIDGAPDCNAVSKLANEISLIIHPA